MGDGRRGALRGRLWLIYNLANLQTADFGVWAMTTDDSRWPQPRWSEPRLPFCFRLNKPTVLSSGEWLLPVT
jgi:sialidase-1